MCARIHARGICDVKINEDHSQTRYSRSGNASTRKNMQLQERARFRYPDISIVLSARARARRCLIYLVRLKTKTTAVYMFHQYIEFRSKFINPFPEILPNVEESSAE